MICPLLFQYLSRGELNPKKKIGHALSASVSFMIRVTPPREMTGVIYQSFDCDRQVLPRHDIFTQVSSSTRTSSAIWVNKGYKFRSTQAPSWGIHVPKIFGLSDFSFGHKSGAQSKRDTLRVIRDPNF
jgi:hypothetical protein